MAAYLIAEVDVHSPGIYDEYRAGVSALVAAHGAKFLVRGGSLDLLEGSPAPKRVVVIEFASMQKLREFYDSAEYQRLIGMRQRAASSRIFAVEGV